VTADEVPRVVATLDSYAGMLDAIRARVNELQVSGERLDEYEGLPRGYYSKVAGAKPIRRLGMTSLAPILNGLGLKCPFIEDPEGTKRLKNRIAPRNSSYVRDAPSIVLTVRFFKWIGRKGAQARVDNSTKESSARYGHGLPQEPAGRKPRHERNPMSALLPKYSNGYPTPDHGRLRSDTPHQGRRFAALNPDHRSHVLCP